MLMTLSEMTPTVRYVHYIELKPEFTSHLQIAYDQRIFFCVNGGYEITVGNSIYRLGENSLLFVPSGVEYRLQQPKKKVLLMGINFDFSNRHAEITVPIVPAASRSDFKKDKLLEEYTFTDIAEFNRPFIINKTNDIFALVQKMLDEYTSTHLYYKEECNAILREILILSARAVVSGFIYKPKNTADVIIDYLRKNYSRHLSNEIIGRELNFHPNYLNRTLIAATGKPMHQFILYMRLNKALDLLQTTDMKIEDIAVAVGFTNAPQFAKFFKAQTGRTPSEFR